MGLARHKSEQLKDSSGKSEGGGPDNDRLLIHVRSIKQWYSPANWRTSKQQGPVVPAGTSRDSHAQRGDKTGGSHAIQVNCR